MQAHQVFPSYGPQPYALVALGAFSGQLASAANPAASNDSSQTCQVLAATILTAPAALTNSRCARLGPADHTS